MFGKQEDPSKTEKATNKRIKKTREEGNVPKSQESTKATSLVAGMIALSVWIGVMYEEMQKIFKHFLSHSFEFTPDPQSIYALAIWISVFLAKMLLPILLFVGFMIWLVLRIQVGKLWNPIKFKPKLSLNIFKAMKQMFFSPQTLLRLLKSLVLVFIIGLIPYFFVKREFANFLPMFYATPEGVAVYMLETGYRMVRYTLVPVLAIAAFDIWQTRYAYDESIKMTKDEVKDERKNEEGDPVIKSQQRRKMMEQMAKRMLQDVPKADVVVTNPTHIAVALRYDAKEAPAPIVLAMGADHLAEKIKEIAREHKVPIRENVSLARALYKSVKVGDMIPEELYKATAAVLASIWRLKGKTPGK